MLLFDSGGGHVPHYLICSDGLAPRCAVHSCLVAVALWTIQMLGLGNGVCKGSTAMLRARLFQLLPPVSAYPRPCNKNIFTSYAPPRFSCRQNTQEPVAGTCYD